MFIAQAHSLAQQSRLAITLAWVAGYTNVVALLMCGHAISHVSGTTSDLGRFVAGGEWERALRIMALLVAFVVGAMVSGATTEMGRRRGWESIYVLPMVIEALLLTAFTIGAELHDPEERGLSIRNLMMLCVASGAMGLQNATITKISSGVVRTTHVTGVLTDLGLELVQFMLWVRDSHRNLLPGQTRAFLHSARSHPTTHRLLLLISIFGSFAVGACLAALAYERWPRVSMLPPVVFLLLVILQDLVRPIAEIEPADRLGAELGMDIPASIAVFHVRGRGNGRGAPSRIPDLTEWARGLSPACRVVILDMGGLGRVGPESAMEVRSGLLHLERQGRRLVLAGIDAEQFTAIQRAGAGDEIHLTDVCPDIELAVARALLALEELGHAA